MKTPISNEKDYMSIDPIPKHLTVVDLTNDIDDVLPTITPNGTENLSLTDRLVRIIKKYDVGTVLNAIKPIHTLFNVKHTFLPPIQNIVKIVHAFSKLSLSNTLLSTIFKINKVLSQSSVNGSIFTITINDITSYLIKVPNVANKSSDPLSYEYYVGLSLNELRQNSISCHLSLVYGRLSCNIEPTMKSFCEIGNETTHVIYENITTKSGNVLTFDKFISNARRKNLKLAQVIILNILIILLITLQKGQDTMQFTHYDLHLNNILIVKLDKCYKLKYTYNGTEYFIVTQFIPFIIDYGRTHIDTSKAVSREKYTNQETQKQYNTFQDFQTDVWSDKSFTIDKKFSKETIKYINSMVDDRDTLTYQINLMYQLFQPITF